MKAISIPQPWAQLVACGYKRIIHTSNLPFDVPERVLIYASGNDPLAKNDGELSGLFENTDIDQFINNLNNWD